MKKLIIHVLFFLSFTNHPVSGQVIGNSKAAIVLHPSANEEMPDSILVKVFNGIVESNLENIVLKKNATGDFLLYLPKNQPIIPFQITAFYDFEKRDIQSSDILYAEPADHLVITFKKNSNPKSSFMNLILDFSGPKSEKYKVLTLLNDRNRDFLSNQKKKNDLLKDDLKDSDFYKSTKFREFLNVLFEDIKVDLLKNNASIIENEALLGANISTFFKYELSSYNNFRYYINLLLDSFNSKEAKQLLSDFYFSKITFLRPISTDPLIKYSRNYKLSRSFDAMFEVKLKKLGNFYAFTDQYNEIKKMDNGALKECLLTQIFTYPLLSQYISDNSSRDSCLNEALKIVSMPELKEALRSQLLFSKGSKIYDFSFQDTSGNFVSLKSMVGKVFMIDFSFLGCSGCALFSEKFREKVHPEFINNPKFKILSVNTDNTREKWFKAIRSKKFSQEGAIELTTGNISWNHPMLKYYNANAFPFILLVNKDGKLISRITLLDIYVNSAGVAKMIRDSLTAI
ncbi:hypothetical protein ABIE26_000686 [Pedobacter africanus]|uniref:Uncharacterized protein n=1 Tax=Pedobacter africanus TaxID=151894 RepID=A0ACC6KUJ9_9SPHI|nr:thioredoxin family protein [Pedobacter africanus]MDR6782827.1 hypothetical protein [Pedobacter africanus]